MVTVVPKPGVTIDPCELIKIRGAGTFDLEAEGFRVNRDGLVPMERVGG